MELMRDEARLCPRDTGTMRLEKNTWFKGIVELVANWPTRMDGTVRERTGDGEDKEHPKNRGTSKG